MRLIVWICLALAVGIAPAMAQAGVEAATCSSDGANSADEMIGVCGLLIDAAGMPDAVRIQALLARAELRRKQDQFDSAIADCTEAIRLDPAAPAGFDCRGNALAGKKD